MRLLLFDIDGTLIRGGPAKSAFGHALKHTFGTAGLIDDYNFAGKTDPQIVRELLVPEGFAASEISAGLPLFWRCYVRELAFRLPSDPTRLLPGVEELVLALSERSDVRLCLVTGNIRGGARLKLAGTGLFKYFRVAAFGSDHEDRNKLPAFVFRRARSRWGRSFDGGDAVVIGDTPRDVACGRAAGAATVAVATGRYSEEELRAAGARSVLPGFDDVERALSVLVDRRKG